MSRCRASPEPSPSRPRSRVSVLRATSSKVASGSRRDRPKASIATSLGREATMMTVGDRIPLRESESRHRSQDPPAERPARALATLADFGFLAALQPVAPALHGGRELLEVDLEG